MILDNHYAHFRWKAQLVSLVGPAQQNMLSSNLHINQLFSFQFPALLSNAQQTPTAGPNGTSLIEIQNKSGVTIQISKKGMFAPGTKNRIVTITGAPNAIQLAQYLIEQKVHEEEAKRRNQNTITGIPGIMQ